jgi:hypothetical protein
VPPPQAVAKEVGLPSSSRSGAPCLSETQTFFRRKPVNSGRTYFGGTACAPAYTCYESHATAHLFGKSQNAPRRGIFFTGHLPPENTDEWELQRLLSGFPPVMPVSRPSTRFPLSKYQQDAVFFLQARPTPPRSTHVAGPLLLPGLAPTWCDGEACEKCKMARRAKKCKGAEQRSAARGASKQKIVRRPSKQMTNARWLSNKL